MISILSVKKKIKYHGTFIDCVRDRAPTAVLQRETPRCMKRAFGRIVGNSIMTL